MSYIKIILRDRKTVTNLKKMTGVGHLFLDKKGNAIIEPVVIY